MNRFKYKIKHLQHKLSVLKTELPWTNVRIANLEKKLALYEKVAQMSHKEIGEQLTYAAGEIEKLKSGYYAYCTSVDAEKKLLNVLRERIKSDNKESVEERKRDKNTDLVEIGCSVDDQIGGFEC